MYIGNELAKKKLTNHVKIILMNCCSNTPPLAKDTGCDTRYTFNRESIKFFTPYRYISIAEEKGIAPISLVDLLANNIYTDQIGILSTFKHINDGCHCTT